MGTVSVRDRLPRDLAVVVGAADTYVAVRGALRHGLGWDAHAYFLAWPGSLYDIPPGRVDAYNYSPAFAQAIWPLVQLPWPVFCGLFVAAAALGTAWLLRPLRRSVGIPLWFAFTPEILSGNIYWLLAVVAVVGVRRGYPWVLPALTKVLPTPGPLWFLLRGEWRRFWAFGGALVAVTALSVAMTPELWRQWVAFLTEHGGDTGAASLGFVPPLWVRLPAALAVLVWGARRNRPWVLAPVMLLSTPVVGMGSFALLAAIPQLLGPAVPAAHHSPEGDAEHPRPTRRQRT
ncbi:glycosyltransferase family 87 protein [Phycicoccus sp. 3266]|uniref:glycosyltransferase family 87 protein n=1 Tax=Phycicoccus sp. 3266 TaxID=2817751 RepID=UPI00285FEC0C|nr:glycosyltransferase family 87 protein [Phycicoccus sp. 3266]MDR6862234.1 hypothetical protein [Phycicoccus sp. 3266]